MGAYQPISPYAFRGIPTEWKPSAGWTCSQCEAYIESTATQCVDGHPNENRVSGYVYRWEPLAEEFEARAVALGWDCRVVRPSRDRPPLEWRRNLSPLEPWPDRGVVANLHTAWGVHFVTASITGDGDECHVRSRYRRLIGGQSRWNTYGSVRTLYERMVWLTGVAEFGDRRLQ